MKKILFAMIIAILAIGSVSAQPRGGQRGEARGTPPAPVQTTVEGTLQLHNGHIVVSSGETFVYVPGLRRYVGFIEGITEGSRVSVSGFSYGNVLRPVQLTVNGKTHQLASDTPPARNNTRDGYGYGYGGGHRGGNNRGGYGYGGGCCGGYGGGRGRR